MRVLTGCRRKGHGLRWWRLYKNGRNGRCGLCAAKRHLQYYHQKKEAAAGGSREY